MSMFRAEHRKLLLRFVLPYICILIIPLITGYLIYHRSLSIMEDEMTRNNLSILVQSQKTLNNRLSEVDMLAQKLLSDSKIVQFQYIDQPVEGANMFKVIDTIRKLADYNPTNNFIFKYYMLYKTSGVVLSTETVYRLPEFYDTVLKSGEMDYEQWLEQTLGAYHQGDYFPARRVMFRNENRSFVTYVRSLGYPSYYQGAVLILIDERQVNDLLNGLDISGGGWAYIADNKGNFITRLSDGNVERQAVDLPAGRTQGVVHRNINGVNMLVTFTQSTYNGWMYVAVQPAHNILEKAEYIRDMTFTFFLISLLIGGLISFFLAYKGSKPIGRLIGTLTEHFGEELPKSRDVYRFLRTTVSRIIHHNRELNEKLSVQLPFLQATIVERLLRGGFWNEGDLRTLLSHAGLVINAHHYAVAIVQLCGYHNQISEDILEELSVKRLIVREKLKESLGDRVHVHESKEDQLILLLMWNEADATACGQQCAGRLNAIAAEVQTGLKVGIVMTLGTFYRNRLDISRSYEEAQQTLVYASHYTERTLLVYDDRSPKLTQYYYPSELETRLGNLVRSGETEQVRKLLDELEDNNFVQRHLSLDMLRLFVYEVWGSLVKITSELPQQERHDYMSVKDSVRRMESFEECRDAFDQLRQQFLQVCAAVNGRKKSRNAQLLEKVIAFIHASFDDESLTLSRIAGELHVSEVYLSQFVKEQTGETFTSYLERKRMEHALELLKETDYPIKDIARMVGYGSSNTFGRAFKRVFGTSAMTYRLTERMDMQQE
jgi:YesN/AraC family two-component response regulator